MKKIIFVGLGVLFHTFIFAQTLTVYDAESKVPLELVTIYTEIPPLNSVTNAKGKADISQFENQEKIKVRMLGYQTLVTSFSELKNSKFEVYLKLSQLNLGEVVISGTKWRQSSDDVAEKIITISAKEVELQNPQTAADLLGISGKVFIQKSQQGGGSPMIRGFATNRLLYSVDGVRMNTAIFRSGNLQNVISLDPFAMQNTEVLFGPGSVIYGSDAVGGVMSFTTLKPQLAVGDKPLISGKINARYSSANNEQTGHADINIGFKKWAFVTSISNWNYDNLRQGNRGPNDYLKTQYVATIGSTDEVRNQSDPLIQLPSAYSQFNAMQKVRFKPSKYLNFEYAFHLSETSPYGRYDRHNRTRNGLPRYARWDYGPQKWMMNNLTVNYAKPNAVFNEFTLRIANQRFEESRIDRDLFSTDENNAIEQVNATSVNADFIKALNEKSILYYGVEYVFNDVNSDGFQKNINSGVRINAPSRYPDAQWSSLGAYLSNEFKVSSKFTLQGGVRYNQFSLDANFSENQAFYQLPFEKAQLNNVALTGNFGAVYRPSETWVISTNFGTAFRSPNVDDIGKIFDSEPGAVTVPNPNLKAEYAYNIDLSMAKIFGNWLKLDVTGYYTILQNALVRRDFTLNGADSINYFGELSKVQAIQNAARANVYGIQAGIEISIVQGLKLISDYNFQYGIEELDNQTTSPSRHAAPSFGVTRLVYRKKALQIQLYSHYQATRLHQNLAFEEKGKTEIYALDRNGNTYSPGWYTLNLKAGYSIGTKWQLNAGIENITNQRYRPYSSGISGPGINIIVSTGFKF